MRRAAAWAALALAAISAAAPGCAGATEIVVDVYTEVDCNKQAEVAFDEGPLDQLDTLPAESTKTGCDGEGSPLRHVGTLVLQPRGDKSALVSFRVVTREDGAPADRCSKPGDGAPCIVAKRRVAFRPHETQHVVVDLRLACAGVACPDDQTCVTGRCVPSIISRSCADTPCDEGDLSGGGGPPPPPPPPPQPQANERVLVVYNSAWTDDGDGDGVQDSLEIASYYAKKRAIPAAHVVGIPTGTQPPVDFATYASTIAAPLQQALTSLGPTTIDVILLVYGIPLGIIINNPTEDRGSVDNYLMGLGGVTAPGTAAWPVNPYYDRAPTFDAELGHFDHAKFSFGGQPMYLVSRLDGPRGAAGVMDLVDEALYGERFLGRDPGAYNGNVYVDVRNADALASLASDDDVRYASYANAQSTDKNIAYTAVALAPFGLPVKIEGTGVQIGDPAAVFTDGASATTAPRALFYGGWDNYGRYGDVFEWLPGSVATDVDTGVLFYWYAHDTGVWWGWNALQRGATCIAGVATEPGSASNPRPVALFWYLSRGYDFVEASAAATPSIGWMPLNVGDPLYTPFAAGKAPVRDTRAPSLVGAPRVVVSGADLLMTLVVDDAAEPEVVRASVAWGPTTTYGTTSVSDEGYFRRPSIRLPSAAHGVTYHYALTLNDPVGNVTHLPDATFLVP